MSVPASAIGLRALQVTAGPATQVVDHGDHHVVRTPSRPDYREGNAVHLHEPPVPADLEHWRGVFDDTVGALDGVSHRLVRWETAGRGRPAQRDGWRAAAARLGARSEGELVLELGDLSPPPAAGDVDLAPLGDPRTWAGFAALQLHGGEAEVPLEFWQFKADQASSLAESGHGRGLIATRMGVPAATAVLLHDDGVAIVEDVVTHPLHRGEGLASALVHDLVAHHREHHPGDRVVLVADPGVGRRRLYRRIGFEPVSWLWVLQG